jgi:hypothetical protein
MLLSLKINADSVVTDWNSGYRNSYIANNGTSVGSSVNSTTNNFVKNLEKIFVLAWIPAGLFSGGIKYPESRSFYKKIFQRVIKYCFESFSRFLQWQTF